MNKKSLKNFFTQGFGYLLFAGATLTAGLLAFSGMLNFTSALVWSVLTFVFAIAVEETVNKKAVLSGLTRVTTKDYLATNIVRQQLLQRIETNEKNHKSGFHYARNNFLELYKAQRKKIKNLQIELEHADEESHYSIVAKFFRARFSSWRGRRSRSSEVDWVATEKKEHAEIQKKLEKEMQRQKWMEQTCVRVLGLNGVKKEVRQSPTAMETAIQELFVGSENALRKEVVQKRRGIWACGFFALLAGIGTGVALYSNLIEGLQMFGGFTAYIPVELLIFTAAVVGLGVVFILFQASSDCVESIKNRKTSPETAEYKKDNSKRWFWRVVLATVGIASAFFLALTTATYFQNTMHMLGVPAGLPATLGYGVVLGSVLLMTSFFNISNAFGVVEAGLKGKLGEEHKKGWKQFAKDRDAAITNRNPIRYIERVLNWAIEALTLLIHCGVTGAGGDGGFKSKGAALTAVIAGAGNEAATDANYTEGHSHDRGPMTEALFFLVTCLLEILRFLAAVWDYGRSCLGGESKSFLQSWDEMCKSTEEHEHEEEEVEELGSAAGGSQKRIFRSGADVLKYTAEMSRQLDAILQGENTLMEADGVFRLGLEPAKARPASTQDSKLDWQPWYREEARQRLYERSEELSDEWTSVSFLSSANPKKQAVDDLFQRIGEEQKPEVEASAINALGLPRSQFSFFAGKPATQALMEELLGKPEYQDVLSRSASAGAA